jgi:hypothetical protein
MALATPDAVDQYCPELRQHNPMCRTDGLKDMIKMLSASGNFKSRFRPCHLTTTLSSFTATMKKGFGQYDDYLRRLFARHQTARS